MPIIEITNKNFETIMSQNKIVFLDFWASWCGPCKAFGPIFEAAALKHPEIVFGKINTETESELANLFQIRSIPTLAIFRDQISLYSQPGALPATALEELISKVMQLDMDKVREQMNKKPLPKYANG